VISSNSSSFKSIFDTAVFIFAGFAAGGAAGVAIYNRFLFINE
jgi:hypothetical protein